MPGEPARAPESVIMLDGTALDQIINGRVRRRIHDGIEKCKMVVVQAAVGGGCYEASVAFGGDSLPMTCHGYSRVNNSRLLVKISENHPLPRNLPFEDPNYLKIEQPHHLLFLAIT